MRAPGFTFHGLLGVHGAPPAGCALSPSRRHHQPPAGFWPALPRPRVPGPAPGRRAPPPSSGHRPPTLLLYLQLVQWGFCSRGDSLLQTL